MKATFQKTVDILVKAYLNDTLSHGSCFACAVGNIVADAIGTKIVPHRPMSIMKSDHFKWDGYDPEHDYPGERTSRHPGGWGAVFCTEHHKQRTSIQEYLTNDRARQQIDATGYTWQELASIEKAFESAEAANDSDRMFNGLMAVVDILADIHGIGLKEKESAKSLFVKTPAI